MKAPSRICLVLNGHELNNNEVGEYFEGLTYSSVAKIKERFLEKLNKEWVL